MATCIGENMQATTGSLTPVVGRHDVKNMEERYRNSINDHKAIDADVTEKATSARVGAVLSSMSSMPRFTDYCVTTICNHQLCWGQTFPSFIIYNPNLPIFRTRSFKVTARKILNTTSSEVNEFDKHAVLLLCIMRDIKLTGRTELMFGDSPKLECDWGKVYPESQWFNRLTIPVDVGFIQPKGSRPSHFHELEMSTVRTRMNRTGTGSQDGKPRAHSLDELPLTTKLSNLNLSTDTLEARGAWFINCGIGTRDRQPGAIMSRGEDHVVYKPSDILGRKVVNKSLMKNPRLNIGDPYIGTIDQVKVCFGAITYVALLAMYELMQHIDDGDGDSDCQSEDGDDASHCMTRYIRQEPVIMELVEVDLEAVNTRQISLKRRKTV